MHTRTSSTRSRSVAAVLAALTPLALTAAVALPSGAANGVSRAVTSTAFTWSGAAEVASNDASWSNPDNWAGGVAPAPGQTVSLDFPRLSCEDGLTCANAENDVTGLKVTSLSFEGDTAILGTGFVLEGPLSVSGSSGSGSGPTYYARADIDVPVQTRGGGSRYPGAGQWTVNLGQLFLFNKVTGSRVTVSLDPASAIRVNPGYVDDPGFQVAQLIVRGGHDGLGLDLYAGSANGQNLHPVKLKDTFSVLDNDVSVGPLRTNDVSFLISDGGYAAGFTPTAVHGDLTFDPASDLSEQFYNPVAPSSPPKPGQDFPAVAATGTVDLNGLRLDTPGIYECDNLPTGSPLAVLSGAAVTGHLTDADGNPIVDGQTVAYDTPDCGTVDVQVDYTPTSVDLTLSRVS